MTLPELTIQNDLASLSFSVYIDMTKPKKLAIATREVRRVTFHS
jgi:hypothetical protein